MEFVAPELEALPDDCPLCCEMIEGSTPADWPEQFATRHHWDGGDVVTFAALTPLRERHVMIVPKVHIQSLAAATQRVQAAAERSVELLEAEARDRGQQLVTFEHGIAPDEQGGCGISHAHVHAIPATADEGSKIIRRVRELPGSVEHDSLSDLGHLSYLRAVDHTSGEVACALGDFASQTLRRLVADVIRSPHDDWRRYGNWDAMQRTDGAMRTRDPTAVIIG